MIIGIRLKELRTQLNLSQDELGTKVGVSKAAICEYEKGSRNPTLKIFIKLVNILQTEPNYLLGRDLLISDEENEYKIKISKEDLNILNEIKENKKLYNKLLDDSKRTIELIDRKIN